MKILHLYSGNLFGGIERMLISIAGLNSSDAEHSFAVCFEGRLSMALHQAGARVDLLPSARVSRPLSVFKARRALARLLLRERFDFVICHGIWSYCMFVRVVVAAQQAPILYLHDPPDARGFYYRWGWLTPPALCIVNSPAAEGGGRSGPSARASTVSADGRECAGLENAAWCSAA
jgi:hypothetical protein